MALWLAITYCCIYHIHSFFW